MCAKETVTGPRLDDARFFGELVDVSRPGLEGIPAAVARGDYAEARRLFAAEVRRTLQPERFFRVRRAFRGSNFMYPGETAAQAAERILRLELISTSTPHQFQGEVDWFINPTFNQYKEWTWQLSRHPEWGILAERYRETGDERYAEGFVRLFLSWVRQAVVPENASGGETLCWRTIEAGIRMGGVWQWALHTFYRSPHFTDDVLTDWYKSVWEHGWRLRYFHRTGNWLIMEMNGLAQIGLLYPQFRDAPAWQQYALDRLVEELDAQVYPDGFQVELSTGYHQVVVKNYQWLMDVYAAYDAPVPEAFHRGLERMHAANIRMMMPDGRLPDVNDGGWQNVAALLEGAVEAYPVRKDFAWARSGGREGQPPRETSLAFDHAGYYVLRTGWDPQAVWAMLDGGPFGYGHQHEDKLNLLLHAYGRLLLTEAGNYAYDDSEMRRYVLSTRAHNTIRVDGQDQNRRANYRREDLDTQALAGGLLRTTDDWDLAEAAYDEGYGPDAALRVTHRRRVLLARRGVGGLGPFLLVIDRLLPADAAAHTYQILWHMEATATVAEGLSVQTRDADCANLTILPAPREGLRVEVVSGQGTPDGGAGAPEWQGWKAIKDHQQGQYAPTPTAVYEVDAAGPVRLVTLLYPTPATSGGALPCPVQGVLAAADPGATEIRLTLGTGETVVLDEEELAG